MFRTSSWIAAGIVLSACAGDPPWETGYLEVSDASCGGGLSWQTADPATYQALTRLNGD